MSQVDKFEKQRALVALLLQGDFDKAQLVLASGANVNAPYNEQGWTPLHAAIEHYAEDAVSFLLRNGADPNVADSSGMTALHLSVDIEADAASQKPPLQGRPVSPKSTITRCLLAAGAAREIKNANGETPLDLAERLRHQVAIDLLRPSREQNPPS